MNFSVTRNGKPLSKELYTWNEEIKIFTTKETGLTFNFANIDNVLFRTGTNCVFYTGSGCTFETGPYSFFRTGSDCVFKTGHNCTFETGSQCVFVTGSDCVFKTGADCELETGSTCIFETGSGCILTRRDIYEVIHIPRDQKIKLNRYRIRGYEFVKEENHMITIKGREIELTKEEFYDLWEQMKKRININK